MLPAWLACGAEEAPFYGYRLPPVSAQRIPVSAQRMIALRHYQTDLVERIRNSFRTNRRVLAVSPTGSGKTLVFSYITKGAQQKATRTMIVAHRQEIVKQISEALDRQDVKHGRIQAGHTQTDDLVSVAMVQTLARRLHRIQKPDFLVVDEAHHAVAGSYDQIMAAWPDIKILGVTATPRRLDGRGLGRSFDAMVIGPEMADLIEQKFLASYRYLAPPQMADLSGIKTKMGDFAIDELSAAMDKSVITGDAVEHYRTHLDGRPAIAFCCSVEHAEHVAQQFSAAGFRAASVDGTMDRADRARRIAGIGNGELNVLTSCELISEGVDVPVVAGAVLLRPTKSLGMYLQQVGRCLRPKPDGSDAVILDHVGNVHRHGLPDLKRQWTLDDKKKKDGAAPVSVCEVCYRAFQVFPGWKLKQECHHGMPEGCVLAAADPAPRMLPEQVSGNLAVILDSPPWADGMSLRNATYREVIAKADTIEKLRDVARARGYNPRWVWRVLQERRQNA